MSEATPEIKQRLQEAFDEMHVGQTFTFRRTFTGGDVAMFCGVTGDYNPYHQDEAFARESPHGRLTTFRDFSQEACSRTSGASWSSSLQRCPSSTRRRSIWKLCLLHSHGRREGRSET